MFCMVCWVRCLKLVCCLGFCRLLLFSMGDCDSMWVMVVCCCSLFLISMDSVCEVLCSVCR